MRNKLPSSSLRLPKKAKWCPKRGVWLWLVNRTPQFPLRQRGGSHMAQGLTSACSSPRVPGLAGPSPAWEVFLVLVLCKAGSFLPDQPPGRAVELRLWEKGKQPRGWVSSPGEPAAPRAPGPAPSILLSCSLPALQPSPPVKQVLPSLGPEGERRLGSGAGLGFAGGHLGVQAQDINQSCSHNPNP